MRNPPAKRKLDPRHSVPDPFPVHYHASSYIVDEECQCGQPRSEHEDRGLAYGHGPSFDGKCERFRWHRFVEEPPYNGNRSKKRRHEKPAKRNYSNYLEEFLA
jgi:hypothetical protein